MQGKDASSVGGLSANSPKTDIEKNIGDGEVINIVQEDDNHYNSGTFLINFEFKKWLFIN